MKKFWIFFIFASFNFVYGHASESFTVCEGSGYYLEFSGKYIKSRKKINAFVDPKVILTQVKLFKIKKFRSPQLVFSSIDPIRCVFRGETIPRVGFEIFACGGEQQDAYKESSIFKLNYGMIDRADPSIMGFANAKVINYGSDFFNPDFLLQCKTIN